MSLLSAPESDTMPAIHNNSPCGRMVGAVMCSLPACVRVLFSAARRGVARIFENEKLWKLLSVKEIVEMISQWHRLDYPARWAGLHAAATDGHSSLDWRRTAEKKKKNTRFRSNRSYHRPTATVSAISASATTVSVTSVQSAPVVGTLLECPQPTD